MPVRTSEYNKPIGIGGRDGLIATALHLFSSRKLGRFAHAWRVAARPLALDLALLPGTGTVAAQDTAPTLTAAFDGMLAAHDGRKLFAFGVHDQDQPEAGLHCKDWQLR